MRMGSLSVEAEAVSDHGRLAATGDPSLARILETCTLAVLGVMNSAWPICRLVRPRRPVPAPRPHAVRGRARQPARTPPAPIHVPDEVLADLQRRLKSTRWPDDAGNEDWYYGVHRGCLEELVDYWRSGYDWRAAEAAINAYEHYRVQVEGVPVHFLRRLGVGRTRSH